MSNITLSLVQTSQNRQIELERFVNSLNNQVNIDFSNIQLIFIDQGENKNVFDKLNSQIEFQYIKSDRCSLSHARNIGLEYVKGIYVGFPDDDCWYEPDTLKKVLAILEKGEYQGVTGRGTNEKGELTSSFPSKASELSRTKRCAAISYTIFLKFDNNVYFDENIGVGSPYNLGSGEETDYLLNLMENFSYRVFYNPDLCIHHPTTKQVLDENGSYKKTYSYARGAGYLIQKHNFPLTYKLRMFGRPLAGLFVNLIMFRKYEFNKSWYNFKGRLEGYMFNLKEI